MSQVTQITIDNVAFGTFRSNLNDTLNALNSMHSGTSRPTTATTGTIWLDTTNAGSNSLTIKFFDGTDDITVADVDTSANTINFIDSTVSADLINDLSPQLGGMLDVNGNAIGNGTEELIKFSETASAVNEITVTNSATGNAPEISATGDDTNIDLKLTPKGSGNLNLDGLIFPNADGTADQVLKTDGSGNLSFVDAGGGGGISWQTVQTTGFTAVAGNGYPCNTTSSAFTVTLPSSPSVGDTIQLLDYASTFNTNNLTINPNSNNIQGQSSNLVLRGNRSGVILNYIDATQGWLPTSDVNGADRVLTVTSYPVDFLTIAGGGGGGGTVTNASSGGGGAGGYRNSYNSETSGGGGSSESSLSFTPGVVYTVTVGNGGVGGGVSSGSGVNGTNGSDSSISGTGITTITSSGGGGGGASNQNGLAGGSGGGGGHDTTTTGGSGTANQGFAGGNASCNAVNQGSAGGGGASAVGASTSNQTNGGDGGDGLTSSITGSSVARAGGGGGGGTTSGSGGAGGGGDGGNGSSGAANAGLAGAANTGGGGGGAAINNAAGGLGGSGVVILRMPTSLYSGTTSGLPTVTTDGSDTILTFTGSGSITG